MKYIVYWMIGLKNLMSLNIMKTYYINFNVQNKATRDMGDIGAILTSKPSHKISWPDYPK
jgi:hypothetical protein